MDAVEFCRWPPSGDVGNFRAVLRPLAEDATDAVDPRRAPSWAPAECIE